jgi:glycosyltransferase involved in cell wall biosynthesis
VTNSPSLNTEHGRDGTKRVLLLLQDLAGGGAERVFVNIANGLANRGFHVDLALGEKVGVYFELLNRDIHVVEIGACSFREYLKNLPALFRETNPTHVMVAGDIVCAATAVVKKLKNFSFQFILTHHYASPKFRSVKLLKEDILLGAIHTLLAPVADTVVAVSEGTKAWLQRSSFNRVRNIQVIYNPVLTDDIYQRARELLQLPGPPTPRRVLVNIGRLSRQKDQATLIRAFAKNGLREKCVLYILGIGPEEAALRALIVRLKLEQDVFLVGYDKNPYRWLARCDVFVLSSINEGFGNVLVEAMAFGKTVVSTDCPSGPEEILRDGAFGYLCEPGNPQALADAIGRGLERPMPAESIVQESRRYHVDNIIGQYAALLS